MSRKQKKRNWKLSRPNCEWVFTEFKETNGKLLAVRPLAAFVLQKYSEQFCSQISLQSFLINLTTIFVHSYM